MEIRCVHCDKKLKKGEEILSGCRDPGHGYGKGSLFCGTCFNDLFTQCCACDNDIDIRNARHPRHSSDTYCEECFFDTFTYCESCDDEILSEEARYSDHNECNYCSYCFEEEGREVSLDSYAGVNFVIKQSETYDKNPFTRLASLEIETMLGTTWEEARDGCPKDWIMIADGSLPEKGAEFLLKAPQNGDMLYQSIDDLTLTLRINDCFVNTSCGLHVHIDARDLYWQELKGILLVGKKVEKYLYKMIPRSRVRSSWCRPLPMSKNKIMDISSNESFVDTWYDSCENSPSLDKYNGSRYHGMNMHSRIYLGSVEFRYHSGTNNPNKMKHWLYVCQSIMEVGIKVGKSLANPDQKSDKSLVRLYAELQRDITFTEFVETLKLTDDVVDYVLKRIDKFSAPDRSIVEFREDELNMPESNATYPSF